MARGKTQPEEAMTDTEADDSSFTLEDEPSTEPEATAEKANDQNTAASKKDPLPEGWETPTAFAHRLSDELEGYDRKTNPFKPQMVYGYVKNGKDFPAKRNTDGHFIVDQAAAHAWYDALQARKAERAAKKAGQTEQAETPAA